MWVATVSWREEGSPPALGGRPVRGFQADTRWGLIDLIAAAVRKGKSMTEIEIDIEEVEE